MNYSFKGVAKIIGLVCIAFVLATGCASKRKKGETGKVGMFFHNMNAKYNGYFNANEIMKKTLSSLEESSNDNYYQLLSVYPYNDPQNVKSISPDMDIAIEKVTTVATLHEPSRWVDDCYVLMGKAQYLKQDYETAEETLEYFQEEFDPGNPYGRAYDKNKGKKTKKQINKEREQERKEAKKEKENERKLKEEAREEAKKEKEEARKAKEEARKKSKKSRKKSGGKKQRPAKKTTEKPANSDTTNVDSIVQKEDSNNQTKISSEKVISKSTNDDKDIEEDDKKKAKKPIVNRYPKGDAGLFGHAPAFYEGVLWLSKTYMEREKYSYAEYLLDKLENEYPSSSDVKNALPAARAHLAIKQKDYNKAISSLDDAIQREGNKRRKARYSFIKGQIHQILNNPTEALAAYTEVKTYNPSHELEFNTTLKIATLKNKINSGSSESVEKEVEKLLKEIKYDQYKDKIYFTIGEIRFTQNDRPGAIEAFQKSLEYSQGNVSQSTETYYKLASLMYDAEDYVEAKVQYDNALKSMDKYDPRYPQVESYSKNLTRISENIELITLQDSLLSIASMTETQQRDLAKKLYKEQQLEPDNAKNGEKENPFKNMGGIKKSGLTGISSFFAYNIASKVKGKQSFVKKWGDRILEDNWRRADKFSSSFGTDPTREEDLAIVEEKELSDAEIKRVLKDVPFGIAEQEKSNKIVSDALYELGVDFRDAIQNYQSSVKTLGKLETRYPKSEHELESFYYQYLSYTDLNNTTKANEYKNKIIADYPQSNFAKTLIDPDYAQVLQDKANSMSNYYEDTYQLFTQNKYSEVVSRVNEAKTLFSHDPTLSPKFALLNAMSVGNAEGKESYMSLLKEVSNRYPNTPEDTRAKEIVRFLKGDTEAFDAAIYEEASEMFKTEDNKLHYVIAVLYSSNESKKRDAKLSISSYNKKYHKSDKLRITDIYLNAQDNTQIILIRKFKDKKEAMKYYDGVIITKGEFIDSSISYDLFAVTQKNYREIIKEKSIKNYNLFFEQNYIDKK